jgi:hypothetical protein
MSDSLAKETANPVPQRHPDTDADADADADTDTDADADLDSATNPADEYDVKNKETSRTASLDSKSSVPQDGLAPVAGNTSEARSTLVDPANPSLPPENLPNDEKHTHVVEENGISGTEQPVKDGGAAAENTERASDAEEDEIVYPGGLQLGLLTFGLCMATFTVALDNTIIATAIPKITTVFDSLGDVGWYGSSYLLTTTALQPSFGRIYTYFNVKYTYLFALCLFELGSIICAAARNSVMLIVGRAVAGAGASALFSGGESFSQTVLFYLLTNW